LRKNQIFCPKSNPSLRDLFPLLCNRKRQTTRLFPLVGPESLFKMRRSWDIAGYEEEDRQLAWLLFAQSWKCGRSMIRSTRISEWPRSESANATSITFHGIYMTDFRGRRNLPAFVELPAFSFSVWQILIWLSRTVTKDKIWYLQKQCFWRSRIRA
jgi:hypothetical protein